MLTHFLGVLVVCELHQGRAVFPLPGFWGLLPVSVLASLWVHPAARVLTHAASAAPCARRDVLLVCLAGRRSALRQNRSQLGSESAFHLTPSVAYFGLSLSAWHRVKCFQKINAIVIPITNLHVLFSFSANSIDCQVTDHALIYFLWRPRTNALL